MEPMDSCKRTLKLLEEINMSDNFQNIFSIIAIILVLALLTYLLFQEGFF